LTKAEAEAAIKKHEEELWRELMENRIPPPQHRVCLTSPLSGSIQASKTRSGDALNRTCAAEFGIINKPPLSSHFILSRFSYSSLIWIYVDQKGSRR